MFIFRDPFRLDKPEPLDPVQAELERRILFAPPGPLDPAKIPTYEQVRLELADRAARGAASARALTLSEAGFGPPVRVVVVHDLDGGVEHIKRAAVEQSLPSAKAEHFRPFGGAIFGLEKVDCGRKDTAGEVLRNSAATAVEIIEVSAAAESPSVADYQRAPSLVVKSGTSPQPQQKLQRPRRPSEPNPDFISKTGSKPKTKLKAAANAKTKAKPKRERTLTISPEQRASAERSFFVAEALGYPFNMKADLNPGHLDDLSVKERIEFCLKIEKNFLAYARGRCDSRGMPYSWWPPVWGWARESTRGTNLEEHVHFVFYAPPGERRYTVKLMEEKRKDPDAKKWCENAEFALIDSFEHWTGAKFKSALGYFVKMANPNDYHPDSTIGYKKSGFITGPRIKISPFLTNPEVVEATQVAVQALMDRRDANRAIMRANGSKPARDPRSLSRPRRPEPSIAIEPAIAVEPAPTSIEPDTCLTPVSIGHVHRGEAERFDMDLVDIETRPATAAIEPIPAVVEAVVHAEAPATPFIAVGLAEAPAFVPDIAVCPATPIPAPAVPPAPGAMSKPSPVSSGRSSAFRSALAALRRSISRLGRGTGAAAGWISSMLFESPGFAAAGVFLGAPDVRSGPW